MRSSWVGNGLAAVNPVGHTFGYIAGEARFCFPADNNWCGLNCVSMAFSFSTDIDGGDESAD